MRKLFVILTVLAFPLAAAAQGRGIDSLDVVWHSPSVNAGGSMPCGGGSVGLNVWVQDGDVLFYMARGGTFDENNALLKLGRIRLRVSPDPFRGGRFTQRLHLRDGSVYISGVRGSLSVKLHLWVDVHAPVIHLEVASSRPVTCSLGYESWRTEDRIVRGTENQENSYRFAPQGTVRVYRDAIGFVEDGIEFYHRNRETTVFDAAVAEQGLDSVKDKIFNPLSGLTFGGRIEGARMRPAGTYSGRYLNTAFRGWRLKTPVPVRHQDMRIYLCTARTRTATAWRQDLLTLKDSTSGPPVTAWEKTRAWWEGFWERSFILVSPGKGADSEAHFQAARNYQLFRYMLGCNALGRWPTKFNGGLFTFDPVLVNPSDTFTPDFRRWGGGTFTAQNQRLLYYPMLKSGDWDMMRAAFAFYRRLLPTARLRTRVYWGHDGASFTEQLENYGLPNPSEYGWHRPAYFDPGMQYNAWLEYLWDTSLEFCSMILKARDYGGIRIRPYLPLIENCLEFFDAHYRYLAERRGRKTLDEWGHLILFPGSACETYKMTLNASSTIAALTTVLGQMLALPPDLLSPADSLRLARMLKTIPPIPLGKIGSHTVIRPAETWERINNVESPQLYPVFPWHIYGLGRPGLDTALNTWRFDTAVIRNRSYVGWKQDNIFAACLGLTAAADSLTTEKLKDGPYRFPAFWGPGFDWAPDHNWGGTGMIGMQDMLLQSHGSQILLFPAWPRDENVHFRLHAPYRTSVECSLQDGKITRLVVTPAYRKKDIVNMLEKK